MASRLHQFQSKACQAAQFVTKNGSSYYKQMMEENKHHIQNPPTVEKCKVLSKQLFYTRIASLPGRKDAFLKEVNGTKQLWSKRRELKIEHAGIAALFGLECYAWFFAGEIVGRRSITGYCV